MTRKFLSTIMLSSLAALFASGCGYSSKQPFRDDIQSVHVEMFHSREFRRNLEFELTEALVKRIEMDTPYRIAEREMADTVLSGEVLEVRQTTLGRSFTTGAAREQAAQIAIRYQWKDQRTGEILVDRPRFVHQVAYIPPLNQSFVTGVDVRGLDLMAERIVETMETGW